MSGFEREGRYIVVKPDCMDSARTMRLKSFIEEMCFETPDCVVVEADWPEYEPVWKMIEDRVTGRSHPLQQTLRDNGDLIALQATIAQQAQMIEHLRGGLTTPTIIDVANADADGYRNGFAAAIKSLPEQQHFTNWAAYTEWRAAQIEAVGDLGGEVAP